MKAHRSQSRRVHSIAEMLDTYFPQRAARLEHERRMKLPPAEFGQQLAQDLVRGICRSTP